jgi:hypothetical protein
LNKKILDTIILELLYHHHMNYKKNELNIKNKNIKQEYDEET